MSFIVCRLSRNNLSSVTCNTHIREIKNAIKGKSKYLSGISQLSTKHTSRITALKLDHAIFKMNTVLFDVLGKVQKYMTQLCQIRWSLCVRPQIINENPVQVLYHRGNTSTTFYERVTGAEYLHYQTEAAMFKILSYRWKH